MKTTALLPSLCLPLIAWIQVAAAPPKVDLEVVTEAGIALDAPQKWMATLQESGFSNLRIRSAARGDKAEVRQLGSDDQPHYAVTGIATSGNVLKLPGANVRLDDKAGLRNWIAKLQDGGEQGLTAKKVMYGLTAKQMLEIHKQLKGTVDFSTKGQKTSEVLRKIRAAIDIPIALDASAKSATSSDEPVADELQGLSHGTALAAALRPLGFAFVPEKKLGDKLRLVVSDAKSVEKSWPVGWDPPEAPVRVAPNYFNKTNAEITDFVLADALIAIQKRVELPFVFDYNALARQRIDIANVKVTSKKGKKSYASVVDDILYQARLTAEVRIDEAEKPFLWITTLKQ